MMARYLLPLAVMLMHIPALAEDYYTKDNLLKFAAYLDEEGEYDRAIGEYLRVVAINEDSRLRDSLFYRIAVAYIHLQRPATARVYSARITSDAAASLVSQKARCLSAYCYYLEKKFDSTVVATREASTEVVDDTWNQCLVRIRIASFLQQFRWSDATVETEKAIRLSRSARNDTMLQQLYTIGLEGRNQSHKNPFLAGMLSAFLPGSGKMYAGRTWDGIVSLFFVGAAAWQAYDGYTKGGLFSVRSVAFGLLGSAFYAGNVYGSVTAARLHNRSENDALAGRIDLRFDW
jgi:hypothetical protein